jgi:hypothetical protein
MSGMVWLVVLVMAQHEGWTHVSTADGYTLEQRGEKDSPYF